MMDLLVKDLDKEMTEAETGEKVAQEDYEKAMADMQSALEANVEEQVATGKELQGLLNYIHNLHTECDWLLQYFSVRKQARADEIDSLGKAKAVLSGAGYSLLQRSSPNLRSS